MEAAERPCPACGHPNRAAARFCESCGRPLEARCATCGNELRPGARFCDACGTPVPGAAAGTPPESAPPPPPAAATRARDPRAYTPRHLAERILTSRSALEGERKQVTVLFADVTGSMELSEQVDPEEWHTILDRFFEILTEGVHRFEGTVNQYTGDGVMALFGAPLAHEDHAHRACWAAVHLQEQVGRFAAELKRERGLGFAMRIGLNSGDVVVGRIGDDLRMDYTAQGHVVGLAARLQALADPGRIYLSDRTEPLVAGYFELEPLGDFRIKGVTEPVGVFALAGAGSHRTRLDRSRARGLSRFVGRGSEMAALEAALERTVEGSGGVVGVVAEAGTGKSRLATELVERARRRGVAVHEGRGVAHGRFLPLVPIVEMLRGLFGLGDPAVERAAEARQKVAGSLVLAGPGFEDALPLVFDFLGIAEPGRPAPIGDPGDVERRTFAVLVRLLRTLGEREPRVVLLEDLHWFDEGSLGFVAALAAAVAGTRILLLVNFRPELRAPWMDAPGYLQLPLLPLGPRAVDELLEDLLGRDPSLDGLAARIRERTGGNPFFVEEVVQSLVEAGTLTGPRGARRLAAPLGDLRVPATVHALLAARIDRLPEDERRVLQAAAVVGKRFPECVLRPVVDMPDEALAQALRSLQARDLLFAESLFPDVEYAFKHPLTQEVAYATQLAERRRLAHGKVATFIESAACECPDERAPLLAHHWEAAGEALAAARWHRRAAERSEAAAPRAAAEHWRAARRLAAQAGDSEEAKRIRLAACVGLVRAADDDIAGDTEADAAFAEGRALAIELVDVPARVRLLLAQSALRLHVRAFPASETLVSEAEAAVAMLDDPELRFVVRAHRAYAAMLRGEQQEALARYNEAFALLGSRMPADGFGLRRYLGALGNQAMIIAETGGLDAARTQIEWFQGIAAGAGDLAYEVIGYMALSRIAVFRGRPRDAVAHARRALEAAERFGAPVFRVTARLALGGAQLASADAEQALAVLEDARSIGSPDSIGTTQRVQLLARLAEAHLGCRQPDAALERSAEAVEKAEGLRRLGAVDAFLARARVLLAVRGAGASGEVDELLRRALELARDCGGFIAEAPIAEERARLAEVRGDPETARREREAALALYEEMSADGHVARLAAALAENAA